MFSHLRGLCRVSVALIAFCLIAVCCTARKISLNKPYPYSKYSTITFLKGDSAVISDIDGHAYLKWMYRNDTIVVTSKYHRHQIDNIKSEIVNKDMDKLMFHINNTSHLTVVHLLDGNMNEIKNVVLAFSNEVKYEPRFQYFKVELHKGVSKPQSLAEVHKGAVINIFIDYPSLPEKYPYDLYEKYVFSKKKLVKVR